jgi:PAS domain S-box-containing protein
MVELQTEPRSILESVTDELGSGPAAPFALARVLVIDDEKMVCWALSRMLKADGYEVTTAQSGKEGVERLRRQHFELAITDLVMPEMDGIQTMAALRELDPDLEVIVITGYASIESAVAALKQGACDFLLKPFNMPQLSTAVTRALEKRPLNTSRSLQALRESEERYRLLFERNLAGVFRGALFSRRILDCNDAYARILGYDSRQEVLDRRKLHDFCEPAELEIARARLLEEKVLTNFETRFCRKDGTPVWLLVNVSLIEGRKGKEPLVEGTLIDITERKQAEQALAQERELLRALMDNLPDSIYFKDRQSRFVRINMSLAKAFGLSDPGQAVGKTDFDFFTIEHAQQAYNDEQEVIVTGKPMMAKEEKETWPDGRVTWVSTTKMPLRDPDGTIIGTFGVSRDITERKRAEEALRASEERYRELFENASDLVFTIDLEAARFTSLNKVAEQTIAYSREEAAQMNVRQLVDPRHWQRVELARARLLAGDSAFTLELGIMAKDGRRVMLEVKPRLIYKEGKPVEVQGIGRDITGREAAEMELRHAQKLESVGRLASGIAHEINTPIQFVGDNTRFLQDSFAGLQALLSKYQELRDAAASGAVSPELLAEVRRVEGESDCAYMLEEIPKALTQTLDGVTRVATSVRAMKDFAHPESKEKAATDLNKALLSTLTVARNELKYVADVETDLGELPLVVCNISDLNQVFLNLLVNAAHAIGEVVKGTREKGKIRIRTVAEGKTVLITITDTGCGIPEGIRSKVFDPFFTTKEVGRGTGQGLAIARSVVVERHKGSLTFESEVGKGTTFYVRLPVDSGEHCEETKVP